MIKRTIEVLLRRYTQKSYSLSYPSVIISFRFILIVFRYKQIPIYSHFPFLIQKIVYYMLLYFICSFAPCFHGNILYSFYTFFYTLCRFHRFSASILCMSIQVFSSVSVSQIILQLITLCICFPYITRGIPSG